MVSRNFGIKPGRECKFCRNNGESKDQYSSHVLRNPNTGQLICPVLRSHVCEICGSTGDKAHTRNYCPKVKEDKKNRLAIPVMRKKKLPLEVTIKCTNYDDPIFYSPRILVRCFS